MSCKVSYLIFMFISILATNSVQVVECLEKQVLYNPAQQITAQQFLAENYFIAASFPFSRQAINTQKKSNNNQ